MENMNESDDTPLPGNPNNRSNNSQTPPNHQVQGFQNSTSNSEASANLAHSSSQEINHPKNATDLLTLTPISQEHSSNPMPSSSSSSRSETQVLKTKFVVPESLKNENSRPQKITLDATIDSNNHQPAKKNVNITEHLLDHATVAAKFSSKIDFDSIQSSAGLDSAFAASKLAADGPNILTPPKSKSSIAIFFECLNNLFNLLLILAGILQYVLLAINFKENKSSIYIGLILIIVAFLNATIEFVQLQKTTSLLKSFMNMIPSTCISVRDGVQSEINAADLVTGDLVFVRMGDKVPADIYVIKSDDLKVDNSSLTGESEPQERFPKNTMENPLEATNLIFNGTHCVSGQCYGIVIRTGDSTVLGQIANLTNSASERKSPLALEIDKFVKLIAAVAITTAIIFFIVGQVVNKNISFSVNFAIGMFAAWIPEGLPATVTMLLTFAAKRLSKRQVLVKNLKGVDTLGAITLLATDKTGTLTRNQMTVAYIWANGKIVSAIQTNDIDIDVIDSIEEIGIKNILLVSALCSGAKFDRVDVPMSERNILADATEAGLVRFTGSKLDNFDQLPKDMPKVFEIPFNSTNKWMMTIVTAPHSTGIYKLYIKGAPERILALCSSIIYQNYKVPLSDDLKQEYNKKYEFMASKGHRVLAFAELELNGQDFPEGFKFEKNPVNYPTAGYTFIGLTSLEDPPKHGVREAIGRFRAAGIQVIMVTGDHPLTAEAIGRKINLVLGETKSEVAKRTNRNIEEIQEDEYDAVVIHGEKIDDMSDADWDSVFRKPEIIFARTSPKNKLQIVQRAQSIGHVVGVTGDGVNDSPALKKSDLGIAMNKSGSDVSKEAASMILLDDNFSSTINGVEEGRLIFANIKKSIRYTVCHSIPEVIPQLATILAPLPVILGPLEIIVIDLGFELFNSLSYAWEPVESREGMMTEVPRNPVTTRSIQKIRERRARNSNEYDPQTGEKIELKGLAKYVNAIKKLFKKSFWKEFKEPTIGETLIDADLLMYSYLEIGFLITIGSFINWFLVLNSRGLSLPLLNKMSKVTGTYFRSDSPSYTMDNGNILTAKQQIEYTTEASSAYFFTIFIMQAFNNYACKSRYRSPLGSHIFRNKYTVYGLLGGFAISILVVYVPPFNSIFNTSYKLSPIWWLPPIGFGLILILYAALRVMILKKYRPLKTNPEIAGLMMYPTIWSTRGSKA
ncbi:Sodium/potassium-transporting ATPase subunit alpha-2 [Smittium culicis]|uniref:Sodium/potassium-transporting ATPase subunit alpha-2 n=1 Tax=Smittium culicis TaxID=133412 RepID=A0A1R1YES0_9FUNG|nr:Sodium/potassium-transporting ATPase subunit alpha-2 [Smittium culicis]